MRDNVIQFQKTHGRLESLILNRQRLTSRDKAKLAENLGTLAAEVNQSDPLAGAQKIIDQSGLHSIWEKRKRYFRLPGEAAPVSTKEGEYGSRGVTFVQLARAAARLLIRSDQPERIEVEARRAIKKLAEGTSFATTSMPTDPRDQTAKSLLDEFAARLSAAVVERTRLGDLWRILEVSPFFVEPLSAYELASVEAPPSDDAAMFPPSLLSTRFTEFVVAGRFVTAKAINADVDWASPRIEIGRVAIPRESRIFVVPKNIAALLSPENDREEGVASTEVATWINAIASDSRVLPEIAYSKSTGFGWKPCFLSVMCSVYLDISPGADGIPVVQIVTATSWSPTIAFSFCDDELREPEQAISEGGFRKSQVRSIEISCQLFNAVHAMPFNEYADDDIAPPVIGIIEHWIDGPFNDGFDAEGWTEDAEISGLLMSNKARFYPTVPDADPINGPLPGGSIGAAILHNSMVASQDTKLATQIITRAQLIADAGLRFYEAMIDRYRESMRNI